MGKKSKRRDLPRNNSALLRAAAKHVRESMSSSSQQWSQLPCPQPGDGPGKGRVYGPEEDTPWRNFCANCYAGVVTYRREADVMEGGQQQTNQQQPILTVICRPRYNCSLCKMVWYCDQHCQKQHWAYHRKVCEASMPNNKEQRREAKIKALHWEDLHLEMLDKERRKLENMRIVIQESSQSNMIFQEVQQEESDDE